MIVRCTVEKCKSNFCGDKQHQFKRHQEKSQVSIIEKLHKNSKIPIARFMSSLITFFLFTYIQKKFLKSFSIK
jgi:hypothetical protein